MAEFVYVGAPVLTFLGSRLTGHLDLLPNGLLLGYKGYEDVYRYLSNLPRRPEPVKSDVLVRYGRENVMARFDEVFLG